MAVVSSQRSGRGSRSFRTFATTVPKIRGNWMICSACGAQKIRRPEAQEI